MEMRTIMLLLVGFLAGVSVMLMVMQILRDASGD